ncbi:PGRP [Mytilus coruscus]|uniref:PGRP n=1 Tax=Mytilus coruscus TaxID=42192 RepID=A0A6J8DH34_MYTCO|nr:PGRP [Mytilus coruscus]
MTSMRKMLCLILLLTITGCCLASDQPCIDLGGQCQDDSNPCSGSYHSGKCSGSASRRCCTQASDQPCIDLGGQCQDDSNPCSGSYHSGKCSGSASRRCCTQAGDQPCIDFGGNCQYDSNPCSGSYYSGKCSGSANRRCCKPAAVDVDQPCIDLEGRCQDDSNKCSGSYYSGKCTGSANRRCCKKTAVEHDTGDCSDVKIISRDSWGARRPGSTSTIHTPVPDFFIHHTDGGYCTSFSACISQMKGIQNYHMDSRKWADIGYSFLVGEDGKIYEGRGWDKVGAHTSGYNSRGLAASFMGNFATRAPNSAALNAVKKLIQCGISKGKVSQSYALFGHRDVSTSTCPGTALYNVIKTWARFKAHSP